MTDLESLVDRIAKLEKSRNRSRALAGVLLLAVCAGALMAQLPVSRTVIAREIMLVDAEGRTTAKITSGRALPSMASLEVTDASDQHMLSLTRLGDSTSLAINPPLGDLLSQDHKGFGGFSVVTSPTATTMKVFEGESDVALAATDGGADVAIAGRDVSHMRVAIQPPPLPSLPSNATAGQIADRFIAATSRTNSDRKTALDLIADSDEARLGVSDDQGFETQVGTAHLQTPQTGLTSRTSAASLMLFGKDRRVLWRAP